MKCICKNCQHSCRWKIDEYHDEETFCNNKMIFVTDEHTCNEWGNETLFNVSKLVVLAIIVVGIVVLLSKFL